MWRKLLSALIALQFLTACPNNGSSNYAVTPMQILPPPVVLSNLTLSTTQPLDYAVSNFNSPTNVTGLNLARPAGGSAMASCVGTYNPATLTLSSNLLPVAAYNATNLAHFYDSTTDRNINFSVSHAGLLSSCYGDGLLFGIGCSLAGFTVTLVNLLAFGSGDLWIVGNDGYGSNALTANKWTHSMAANISGTTNTDGVNILGNYLGKLYFSTSIGGVGKLYRTDGTSVQQVTQFNALGVDDIIGSSGVEFQGKFYFTASTGSASLSTLYRLNPNDTVERVATESIAAKDFAIFQSQLYFSGLVGDPALGKRKLMRYDGSSLCQVSDINVGNDAITHLRVTNDKLYFLASAPAGSEQAVMSYDGATIKRLTNTYPGGDDAITSFVIVGTSLFLNAKNTVNLSKLFEITSTQVLQTSNLAGNAANDGPVVISDLSRLYFTASNASNRKLYTIESGQIVQISNINAGNDVFTPLANHNIIAGELWVQYVDSSGQGALAKVTRQNIQVLNKPAWYQSLSGIPAGVNTVSQIAQLGHNYIYKDAVNAHSKIYLMKR